MLSQQSQVSTVQGSSQQAQGQHITERYFPPSPRRSLEAKDVRLCVCMQAVRAQGLRMARAPAETAAEVQQQQASAALYQVGALALAGAQGVP